jgi:hypothetical protein
MDINKILQSLSFNFFDLKGNVKTAFEFLVNLIEKLSTENRELQQEIQRLRDENNRLKGEQGKPDIKPNTPKNKDISSEKERKANTKAKKKRKKRAKNKQVKIDRTVRCNIDKDKLPSDAVFKGYQKVIVQDIKIQTDNIQFEKEVYYSPSTGKSYLAPLPPGYEGEFGPTLKALTLILKNVSNMSEAKIFEFFKYFGIYISMGTISNILIKNHQSFHQEKTDIVEAGLKTTVYQAIDDTKARVNGKNYHTQIIGNPFYRAYFTEPKKNRLTILNVLMNRKPLMYCLNRHAFKVLKQLQLSKKHFKKIKNLGSENIFTEQEFENLISHEFPLIEKGVKSKIFEAAAIAAYRKGKDHLVVKALLCDDAPQFKLICKELALCWVHDGRHYKKLNPVFKYNATKVNKFLKQYWKYYHQLLEYKNSPTVKDAELLSNKFDQLFSKTTGYNDLDDRILKTKMKKEQLLLVLKYPQIPLHNNDMELGARVCARKRDVSLHTMTDEGTKANDTFLTIIDTCKKLDVNPFQYFIDRIKNSC